MGWFDDDDDDDDDDYVSKKDSQVIDEKLCGKETSNVEEEEDPLDKFMKGLDTKAKNNNFRSGRLDVANEEEATSHWETTKNITKSPIIRKSIFEDDKDDKKVDEEDNILSKTFHRAGSKNKKRTITSSNSDDEYEGDSDFWAHKKFKQECKDINPLQKIVEHDKVEYKPFIKCLYAPNNDDDQTFNDNDWRQQHLINVYPPQSSGCRHMHLENLKELFNENQNLIFHNIQELTSVQSQVIPIALSGKDVLVTAPTGSGKTLCYVWPIMLHLQCNHENNNALILTPTRELAQQVTNVCNSCFGINSKNNSRQQQQQQRSKNSHKVITLTGGSSLNKSDTTFELLKTLQKFKPQIWIATPGRLIQMASLKKRPLDLTNTSFLVVDEADKMLQMGFESQVTSILKNINPRRQSIMISATFGSRVEQSARKWLLDPVRVAVGRTGTSSQHVQQHVMILPSVNAKQQWLLEMLPIFAPLGQTLVFCATKQMCDNLVDFIRTNVNQRGSIPVDSIHGDKHQSDRLRALKSFKKNNIIALIATDVAARGLDIDNVTTVVNFDPAKNIDAHVHRVGRAGRMSRKDSKERNGVAYTLFTANKENNGRDADSANALMEAFHREGRDQFITDEWMKLAMQSRHYCGRRGGTANKLKRFNGLGFTG